MRFSILDLLLLAVIVGLAVSWWSDRSRLVGAAREDRDVIAGLEAAGVDPRQLLSSISSASPGPRAVPIRRGLANRNGFNTSSDYQSPPGQRKLLEEKVNPYD